MAMSQRAPRVGIVGAGVAGLVCARELEKAGAEVEVFEAAERVGGRVQTDDVEGFKLDVGFQILLDAYPEVRRQLNLPGLQLRGFAPGAVLADKGRLSVVAHPLKCPGKLLQTLRTAISWGLWNSCADVMRLVWLASGWLFKSPYSTLTQKSELETTDGLLKRLRLSPGIVQKFLRPFFEAIYVSPLEQQSASLFQFVLRMLAVGGAMLPAGGMRAIPQQLADSLRGPIRLSTPVDGVRPNALQVSGKWVEFDAVVVAADWPAAGKLINLSCASHTRSATWYFALPGPPPVLDPLIVLQSYDSQLQPEGLHSRVVNIGFPSVVQSSYAPPGMALAAVTIMGKAATEDWVRTQVECMLGVDCSAWRHLRTYDIAFHQPAQVPLHQAQLAPAEVDGVFCCGDHRSYPTLDGAMLSGRSVAEALLPRARAHAAGQTS